MSFAKSCRDKALEGCDKDLYAALCATYKSKHGIEDDFDFFDYAAKLGPNLPAWKIYITELRAMGRWWFPNLTEENKAEYKVIVSKAQLMGIAVTPTISRTMFPQAMAAVFTNKDQCARLCQGIIDSIVQEEAAAKQAEYATTLEQVRTSAAARGVTNPIAHFEYTSRPAEDVFVKTVQTVAL